MTGRIIILLSLTVGLLGGCDGAGFSDEWASPEVRVSIIDAETGTALSKSFALLNVELEVRSQGGRNYSPEPMTVDNAVARLVGFDVSIPPDSLYSFSVRFTSSGRLVGEGATIQEVTLETTLIEIGVLQTSTTAPSIAFVPSEVTASTGGEVIDVALRLYGADATTAGAAVIFDITGPTPQPFVLEGAGDELKVNFVDGNRLNAAWQFGQVSEEVRDIATLRIPRTSVTDYCLEADENNVRIVNRNGEITQATLLGTCVTITQ